MIITRRGFLKGSLAAAALTVFPAIAAIKENKSIIQQIFDQQEDISDIFLAYDDTTSAGSIKGFVSWAGRKTEITLPKMTVKEFFSTLSSELDTDLMTFVVLQEGTVYDTSGHDQLGNRYRIAAHRTDMGGMIVLRLLPPAMPTYKPESIYP